MSKLNFQENGRINRAIYLMRAAIGYIENYPDFSVYYDDQDCDGYCLQEDIQTAIDELETMLLGKGQPIPLTGVGQIEEGDAIELLCRGKTITASVDEVLFPGQENEEVIYNSDLNHYFITGMVITGQSNAKNVLIIKRDQ